jgi:hypothetical protein
MQTELLILIGVKALLELAGFLLFGQAALYLILGAGRERSRLYRLLRLLVSPMIRFTRLVTPGYVGDRHVPYLAFLIVFWAWLLLVLWLLPDLCGQEPAYCAPLLERRPSA